MRIQLFLLMSLFLAVGCQLQQERSRSAEKDSIAGVWSTSDAKPWKLTLAENGIVTDVLRTDGLHFDIGKGRLELEGSDEMYAHYIFGPCTWSYNPATRQLDVLLAVSEMVILTAEQEFKCSFTDEFNGPVSEDGRTWTPEWIQTTKYGPPVEDQVASYGRLRFNKVQ